MRKALVYLQILAGTIISALGINLFMVPAQIPSGGLGGLTLILNYLWRIPIGPTYFAANVPALLWLYKVKGWQTAAKSLFGIACFSIAVQVTGPLSAHAPTHDLILCALFGGVLLGVGAGLALAVGGDTGGNSSYARIVHHYTGFSIPSFMMLTDFLILAFGAIMLSVESILYALIISVACAYAINLVQDGLKSSRCLLIISEQPDEVGAVLLREINRGVTRLDGWGEYTGLKRPVLMCVVSPTEAVRVKRLVMEADPEAFLIVTDAREVSGRGFTLDHELRRLPYWAVSGD